MRPEQQQKNNIKTVVRIVFDCCFASRALLPHEILTSLFSLRCNMLDETTIPSTERNACNSNFKTSENICRYYERKTTLKAEFSVFSIRIFHSIKLEKWKSLLGFKWGFVWWGEDSGRMSNLSELQSEFMGFLRTRLDCNVEKVRRGSNAAEFRLQCWEEETF